MENSIFNIKLILLVFFISNINYATDTLYLAKNKELAIHSFKTIKSIGAISIDPPKITATGDQMYCPGSSLRIVETISISHDVSDIGSKAISIQIASGYIRGEDMLILTGNNPLIVGLWYPSEGKLKLVSLSGSIVPYTDFETAIKNVEFSSSSLYISGDRKFSINLGVGNANYLPRNGHFYEYIQSNGITWTKAQLEASNKTYYGLQGYLATITASDESQLAGAQAQGTGWIGGTDEETEGTWKWVTGPEGLANSGKGTVFWKGNSNGSATLPDNFAFWNNNEPNQHGDEDYAHITAPGIGIPGSWNDLSNTGDTNYMSPYHPQGYIVEYGGMPSETPLQISASTSITIPKITEIVGQSKCGPGILTLEAKSNVGIVNWFDSEVGGTIIATGTSFTTPLLSQSTTYYAEVQNSACTKAVIRTEVTATIINIPIVATQKSIVSICGEGNATVTPSVSEGTIYWYSDLTGNNLIATGDTLIRYIKSNTTFYVQAVNNGCTNGIRMAIDIVVYPFPIVSDQTIVKCMSAPITLDAAVANVKYLWSNGAITKTIEVVEKGIYNVAVTSLEPESCTSNKIITVNVNEKPEIKNISVDETTVKIELVKYQTYFEYSIDGYNYQSSNVFKDVSSGLQTAYAREVNLCNTDQKTFIVIVMPKFFTPNNDSYNDVWGIKGLINYPQAELLIFDRYGKLIRQLNSLNSSWDGTFNNNQLPATDYWYILKLEPNSPEFRGHFSLKR
jgi:gliding motility-associated-like protein